MFRLALHWQILIAMVVGAGIGLALNLLASDYQTPPGFTTASGRMLAIQDSADRIEIEITDAASGKTESFVVDSTIDVTKRAPGEVPTLNELQKSHPQAYDLFQTYGRSTARWVGDMAKKVGDLFLRMLKMVAVPLIIVSLLSGVTGLGDASRLGRMFGRTLLYYLSTSMLAIVTGLLLVNLIKPGITDDGPNAPVAGEETARDLGTVLWEQLETLIPDNPFAALATANFLSIISFTLAVGVFSLLCGGRTLERVHAAAEVGFDVMMRMTVAIIQLAPIGVLCFILYATATQGIGVFASLGMYMLTVALALLVHACVTLPLIVRFVAGRSPREFARAMSPALLTAFSSSSSNATLPLTLSCVENRAGVSNRVSSFVLPLGATVNMDGTALYEAVAVLFIAQLTYGDLPLAQQVIVALTALLASIGAAGIPQAGLVMMVIILQAVGLPSDLQMLIIGVDRVLDMCRTSVNVWSDACGCAVVARFDTEEAK